MAVEVVLPLKRINEVDFIVETFLSYPHLKNSYPGSLLSHARCAGHPGVFWSPTSQNKRQIAILFVVSFLKYFSDRSMASSIACGFLGKFQGAGGPGQICFVEQRFFNWYNQLKMVEIASRSFVIMLIVKRLVALAVPTQGPLFLAKTILTFFCPLLPLFKEIV